MFTKLNFTLFFLLFTAVYLHAETISLQKALAERKVSVEILVNENGTHYSTPFLLKVNNLTRANLSVQLDNGTLLIADQEEFQNFIVTEQRILALSPNNSKSLEINAMCIEQSDSAPNESSGYKIGDKANETLCALSKFVESNKANDPNAQFLMWDLAENKYKLTEKEHFEIDKNGEVWIVSLDESGKKEILNKEPEYVAPPRELKVHGNFSMNLSGVKKIHIAMFNMQNILVKELYNNPNTPKGANKVEYAFNSLEFPDVKYQIKLVMDGRVMMSRVVVMDI